MVYKFKLKNVEFLSYYENSPVGLFRSGCLGRGVFTSYKGVYPMNDGLRQEITHFTV